MLGNITTTVSASRRSSLNRLFNYLEPVAMDIEPASMFANIGSSRNNESWADTIAKSQAIAAGTSGISKRCTRELVSMNR